jgi:hypothetical protein
MQNDELTVIIESMTQKYEYHLKTVISYQESIGRSRRCEETDEPGGGGGEALLPRG